MAGACAEVIHFGDYDPVGNPHRLGTRHEYHHGASVVAGDRHAPEEFGKKSNSTFEKWSDPRRPD
jgi:hypothetical protein